MQFYLFSDTFYSFLRMTSAFYLYYKFGSFPINNWWGICSTQSGALSSVITVVGDKCMMKGKSPEILKAAKDEIQNDLVLLEQMKMDSEKSSKYC